MKPWRVFELTLDASKPSASKELLKEKLNEIEQAGCGIANIISLGDHVLIIARG